MTTKPRIILGCMTFGPAGTNCARVTSVEGTRAMFNTLKSYSHTEIDTARMYCDGKQENYTKQAGGTGGDFRIATKVYPTEPGMHKPAQLRATFEHSLKELGVDAVDILYLHAPDRSVPFEETVEEMNKLYEEKKFKIFGLSNFAAWEVAEICEICISKGWIRPRIYQAMLNALARAAQDELIPCARHYGIDVVIYNPIAGGVLSGRYKNVEMPEEGRFSDANGNKSTGSRYRNRYFNQVYLDAVSMIEAETKQHGLTLVETALRWTVHHSSLKVTEGDGVIIGASSQEQLESNLKDFDKGPLPLPVVKALDEAWEHVKAVAPTYWR